MGRGGAFQFILNLFSGVEVTALCRSYMFFHSALVFMVLNLSLASPVKGNSYAIAYKDI